MTSQTSRPCVYAQTNLQLLNQLRLQGYSEADLATVCSSYGCAVELFTGSYRGSGKTFLSHLVGTASVLAWVQAPAVIVAAGVLHAAYSYGDFGAGWLGMSEVKRRRLRERIGEEIEGLVLRYTIHPWNVDTPAELCDRLAAGGEIDREVALMRLANEVDEHLDLGVLYCRNAEERLRSVRAVRTPCVELARRLGYPQLAEEIDRVSEECLSSTVAESLRTRSEVAFVVPTISRRRWRLRRIKDLLRLRW